MKVIIWLVSLLIAFSMGAERGGKIAETDDELRARVQGHMDVIVDESAAIVDEVAGEIRSDERVQQAEQFARDAQEIASDTLTDLAGVADSTREKIEEKFGKPAEAPAPEEGQEAPETPAPEAEQENPEAPVPPAEETPAPGEPING